MKRLIDHRLLRLFFLLIGICAQDQLIAMNVLGFAENLNNYSGFKPLTRKQAGIICNDLLRALKTTTDFKKLGQKRRNKIQRALYRIYPKLAKQFSGKINVEYFLQEVRIVLESEELFKDVKEVFNKLIRTMIHQDEKNEAPADEDAEEDNDEDRKRGTSWRSLQDRFQAVSLDDREDNCEDDTD